MRITENLEKSHGFGAAEAFWPFSADTPCSGQGPISQVLPREEGLDSSFGGGGG